MTNPLRGFTLQVGVQLVTQVCIVCGGVFALPAGLDAELRKNHNAFFCPAGHSQAYLGQNEAERLRDELAAEQRRTTRLRAQVDQASAEVFELSKAKQKLERAARATARRTTNGACTLCKRHFVNVERHMQSKHADAVVGP